MTHTTSDDGVDEARLAVAKSVATISTLARGRVPAAAPESEAFELLGEIDPGPLASVRPRRHRPGSITHPAAVSRALDWLGRSLDQDPARRISLPELAAASAVTPKHLCRLFAASVGRSRWRVRLLRPDRALVLLARSNLSVQEVGRLFGFSSPNHFSRCFRSVYGGSPLAVRRALLAGQVPPSSPLARRP